MIDAEELLQSAFSWVNKEEGRKHFTILFLSILVFVSVFSLIFSYAFFGTFRYDFGAYLKQGEFARPVLSLSTILPLFLLFFLLLLVYSYITTWVTVRIMMGAGLVKKGLTPRRFLHYLLLHILSLFYIVFSLKNPKLLLILVASLGLLVVFPPFAFLLFLLYFLVMFYNALKYCLSTYCFFSDGSNATEALNESYRITGGRVVVVGVSLIITVIAGMIPYAIGFVILLVLSLIPVIGPLLKALGGAFLQAMMLMIGLHAYVFIYSTLSQKKSLVHPQAVERKAGLKKKTVRKKAVRKS